MYNSITTDAIELAIKKAGAKGQTPLEAARRFRGLTSAKLAGLVGTSAPTIGRLENGYRPSLALKSALARELDCPPDLLFPHAPT